MYHSIIDWNAISNLKTVYEKNKNASSKLQFEAWSVSLTYDFKNERY